MALPNAVPSRAALHALRGIVFTTSCSVILLAEERRRRTKVARAAIDNARKLHTIKAQRRPLARLESQKESQNDSDLAFLAVERPPPGTPRPRRRRRASPGKTTHGSTGSVNGPEPPNTAQTDAHPAQASINIPAPSLPHTRDLVLAASRAAHIQFIPSAPRPPSLETPPPLLPSIKVPQPRRDSAPSQRRSRQTFPQLAQEEPESIVAQSDMSETTDKNAQLHAQQAPPRDDTQERLVSIVTKSNISGGMDGRAQIRTHPIPRDPTCEILEPNAPRSDILGITDGEAISKLGHLSSDVLAYVDSAQDQRHHVAASSLMRQLVEGLEALSTMGEGSNIAKYQLLALRLVETALAKDTANPGSVNLAGLRDDSTVLLQIIAKTDGVALADALDVVLPLHQDIPELIAQVLGQLSQARSRTAMHELLRYLSLRPQRRFTLDYRSVMQLLRLHHQLYNELPATMHLYDALMEARLPTFVEVPEDATYIVQRLKLQLAAASLENSEACVEASEQIKRIDERRAKNDPTLQHPLLIADSLAGRLERVEDVVRRVEQLNKSRPATFRKTLEKLMDIFLKRMAPEVFEGVFRLFVGGYGVRPRSRWLYSVLGRYSDRLDKDGMFGFVNFSMEHGYKPTRTFFAKFCQIWRKRWSVTNRVILQFYETLREVIPDLDPPIGFMGDTSARGNRPYAREESWESLYVRSTATLPVPADAASNPSLFASLQEEALAGSWEGVWAKYEQDRGNGGCECIRSLRLAVVARLKLDDGVTDRAGELVAEAHSRGVDVSSALTPLLMAQIAEGRDPTLVVDDIVQRGFKVHDMVYNRAGRRLFEAGNLAGMLDVSTRAVRENGMGDTVYNGFIFSNLVIAYTGLCKYMQLSAMLQEFQRQKRWWGGSKVSMEAIKFAMKLVARRLAVERDSETGRRNERAMEALADAYRHCRACREPQSRENDMVDWFTQKFSADHGHTTHGRVAGDSAAGQAPGADDSSPPLPELSQDWEDDLEGGEEAWEQGWEDSVTGANYARQAAKADKGSLAPPEETVVVVAGEEDEGRQGGRPGGAPLKASTAATGRTEESRRTVYYWHHRDGTLEDSQPRREMT